MAGTDPAGRRWAESYDAVATDAVRGFDALETALDRISAGLAVTGYNYAMADSLSAGRTGSPPGHEVSTIPSPACSTPPPSALGGNGVPDVPGWDAVAGAIGDLWPNGDTSKLRVAQAGWSRAAQELDAIAFHDRPRVLDALSEARTPEIETILGTVSGVFAGVCSLSQEAADIADACGQLADQIDAVRRETDVELAELVAEIGGAFVLGAVLTPITAGVSDALSAAAAGSRVWSAAHRILTLIAHLAERVSTSVARISTSAARVGEIVRIPERITVRVVVIAGRVVVNGSVGSAASVALEKMKDPDFDVGRAAARGFAAGVAFGEGARLGSHVTGLVADRTGLLLASRSPLTFTGDEGVEWGSRTWARTVARLSPASRKALADYTSDPPHWPSYTDFNAALRGRIPMTPDVWHRIANIDKALEAMPLPRDVIAMRDTDLDHIPVKPQAMEGMELTDDAYTSVSLGEAPFPDKDAVIELLVPEGTPAMYIGGISSFGNTERELLLGRGLTQRVDSVRLEADGRWHIKATVVKK